MTGAWRSSRHDSTTSRRTRVSATTPTSRRSARSPPSAAAGIGGRSWDLEARVDRKRDRGGVILAMGTENAGVALFVQDNRLVFDYNIFMEHHVLESTEEVPDGASVLGARFRRGRRDADVTLDH